MIEPSLIVEKLKEMNYPESNIIPMVNELSNLSEKIVPDFLRWLSGETNISLSIEGFSFEELTEDHELNSIAAFLTLDWLDKEPEVAKPVINKGYDYVDLKEANA